MSETQRKTLVYGHFYYFVLVYVYASENPLTRVYTWGMACYGALGCPELLRPKQRNREPSMAVHKPSRCAHAETKGVRDVACGYGFTVFALDNKKFHIMGTGINKDGQIGESSSQLIVKMRSVNHNYGLIAASRRRLAQLVDGYHRWVL